MRTDDYLRELIEKSRLESPSDDFVERVMSNIQLAPDEAPVKRPFYLYFKTAIPYAAVMLVLIFIFATSDLPFFNWIPGKEYFLKSLFTTFGSLFTTMNNAFASKYVSLGLLIGFSAGLLFIIDRWFSRQSSV